MHHVILLQQTTSHQMEFTNILCSALNEESPGNTGSQQHNQAEAKRKGGQVGGSSSEGIGLLRNLLPFPVVPFLFLKNKSSTCDVGAFLWAPYRNKEIYLAIN